MSDLLSSVLAQAAVLPRPPFRPFIDPMELHAYWWILLFPISLGVAMVYKAVRLTKLERYWMQVVVMTVQIILAMIGLAIASYFLVMVYAEYVAGKTMP